MTDSNMIVTDTDLPINFIPRAVFDQTCGHCGAIFRVEVAQQTEKGDLAEYRCPACNHHVCRVNSSSKPHVKLLSYGEQKIL